LAAKKLTFWEAVAVGLGNIVGAGIFVLAGSAVSLAGPGALAAFMVTAALATAVGWNSAELSSKLPAVEGGVYSFAKETLGDSLGFLVGWFRLVAYAVSGGAVALGFSGYLVAIGLNPVLYYPAAALLIVALALVELGGLKLASDVEKWLVAFNVLGLSLVVVSVLALGRYTQSNFQPVFPGGALGTLQAASIAFFAYSGFNTISTLTPDVEEGARNVPRAIIASLGISTVLYMLVVFAMVFAMNWRSYGFAPNPVSLALSAVRAPVAVSLVVEAAALTATFTVTLSLIIAGSRTTGQMGKDCLLPSALGRGKKLPTAMIAALMLSSLALGNVRAIALVANFGVIFSYMLSGVEVMVARRRGLSGRYLSRGYPYVQLFSVCLSALMILSLGFLSIAIGTLTMVAGIVVHSVQTHLVSAKKSGVQ
jgi:APA family basic amino acid/polyamine antiporter